MPAGQAGVEAGVAGMSVQTGTSGTVSMPPMGGAGFNAGTDAQRNAIKPGMVCDRLSTIQCAAEAACCATPRDGTACKQAQMQSCSGDFMADVIASQPAAGFDTAQAKTVLDHLEVLASQCDPTIAAFAASPQGLRSMFRGTVAPNGKCNPANAVDKMMAAGALASCTNGEGYACLPSMSGLGTWLCAARATIGGHCFSDINCQQDLFCNNPNLVVAGSTCMMRKAIGASCMLGNECQSLFCIKGQCVTADQMAAYCPG